MSAQATAASKRKAYIKLLQNPYASLSLEDAAVAADPPEASAEQKRAYFRLLQNPHAHDAILGETDIGEPARRPLTRAEAQPVSNPRRGVENVEIGKLLDEVLRLYRPYVARNEWSRVIEYRAGFLERATRPGMDTRRVRDRLASLKFSLMPNEKVEYNRAPAERIIAELEKLLT